MKNLAGLPERWAVNIVAEAEHPRMGEFKSYFQEFNYDFDCAFYGFNVRPDYAHEPYRHVSDCYLENVTFITLDRFFEALDASTAPVITDAGKDWQPKRGEIVEVSSGGNYWYERTFYGVCGDFFVTKEEKQEYPTSWKHIRPIEQPTQLKIEDAKAVYIKALNLEGKKIDWV